MTMLLLAALLAQTAQATVTFTSSPLVPNGDNQPALQAFIDGLPEGTTLSIPDGTWPLHSPLRVNKKLKFNCVSTRLKAVGANWTRGVVIIGDYDAGTMAHDVEMKGMIFEQAVTGPNKQTCVEVYGDRFKAFDCGIVGCRYEGIVVHGPCKDAYLEGCWADTCGLGGEARPGAVSAFNVTGANSVMIRCRTKRCGQGFEIGGKGTVCDGCVVEEPAMTFSGTPSSLAFNIGSMGWGVHDVTIKNCRTYGYASAIGCGNTLGRLSNIKILYNRFDGGAVGFSGGKPVNNVPGTPFEGPDLHGSLIEGNTIVMRGPHYGVIGYHLGNTEADQVYGRENLTVKNNVIVRAGALEPSSPFIYTSGKVTADLVIEDNVLIDTDAAPSRGDFQAFSFGTNVMVPGFPNLTMRRNEARTVSSTVRTFVINIEGAP